MIKTTVAGQAWTQALERQQRWVDRRGHVDAHVHATRDLIDALESAPGARQQPLRTPDGEGRPPIGKDPLMNRAFAKAFALWEAGFRAHPEKYMTADETAAADALPLSEQRAEYFEALLATLAVVEDDR